MLFWPPLDSEHLMDYAFRDAFSLPPPLLSASGAPANCSLLFSPSSSSSCSASAAAPTPTAEALHGWCAPREREAASRQQKPPPLQAPLTPQPQAQSQLQIASPFSQAAYPYAFHRQCSAPDYSTNAAALQTRVASGPHSGQCALLQTPMHSPMQPQVQAHLPASGSCPSTPVPQLRLPAPATSMTMATTTQSSSTASSTSASASAATLAAGGHVHVNSAGSAARIQEKSAGTRQQQQNTNGEQKANANSIADDSSPQATTLPVAPESSVGFSSLKI